MNKEEKLERAVVKVVDDMMQRVLDKVLVTEPFDEINHHQFKPLYAALVPDEIFKGAYFERRFVTPFGLVWEKLAIAAGYVNHGVCLEGHTVTGTINSERLRRIQEVLDSLEHKAEGREAKKPNWNEELKYILAGGGDPVSQAVVRDIYLDSQTTGKKYSFELKAPLPNSDQTKVSKEKMFKLLAMNEHPIDEAYYALPYNPYGSNRSDYDWSFPKRWFDMVNDPCVLIGDDFWNLIGGPGTYDFFIKEMNKLGADYKKRIYREYLGVEPPEDMDNSWLK